MVSVPFDPVLEALDELRANLAETQRETLRAVQEHGCWARRRHKSEAVLDQLAKDDGEQLVRAWERSVGR